jgi:uncharacterized protein YkwD
MMLAKRTIAVSVLFIMAAALPEGYSAPASFQQATAEYNAGHISTALSEFETYKLAYPSNPLVRYYIGLCHQQLGQPGEAKGEFEWVSKYGDNRLRGLAVAALRQLPNKGESSGAVGEASVDELEAYCLSLINDSRHQEGLPPLQVDGDFARLAREYANYMAQNPNQYEVSVSRSPHVDLQGRNQLQRATAAGLSRRFEGECIGRTSRGGYADKTMILTVHKQMMSEPAGSGGHRDNIMNQNATVIGIGVARLPKRLYLTEEFGQH